MLNTNLEMIFDVDAPLGLDLDFNNISEENSLLDNNKKWEISAIALEYFNDKELSDETIFKLRDDFDFRVNLLNDVQNRMEDIIVNSSTLLYKELVTVINLLSLGKKYKIFEKYNEYSSSEISKLFKDYESQLVHQFSNNEDSFNLTFDYYLTLLDAFNELSIINLTDIKRKKSINSIITLITESINTLKYSVHFGEEKLAQLNSFHGELILRFSNILYLSTENKNIDELITQYKQIYNKQVDGYLLSCSKLIKNESKSHENYVTFLYNSTESLLLLLMKLDTYEGHSFDKLKDIVDVYTKECQIVKTNLTSIDDFRTSLLNNLVYICDDSIDISHKDLVKYILDKSAFSITNMQIIHNIILFCDDINKNNLIYTLKYLLKTPKVKNDYHEYHKLKIVDIIINKFIKYNGFEGFTKTIPLILEYMNTSNTASHLMSVFSKIRLSLSQYFSLLGEEYLYVSQEQYFIGEQICSYTLIKDEYKCIFENILLNNAKSHFKSLSLTPSFNSDEFIKFGYQMMNDFITNKNIKIKYEVNNEIEKIIEYILQSKQCELSQVEEYISFVISQKIFFKLAVCKVIDASEDSDNFKEIGYEILEQTLISGYKILYKYSYSYKDSFNEILNKNDVYIKKNITNLLLSYLLKTKT